MDVASKRLGQELYELSGWEPENWYDLDPDGNPEEYFATTEDRIATPENDYVAAYDLGFLLRKLPHYVNEGHIEMFYEEDEGASPWCFGYHYSDPLGGGAKRVQLSAEPLAFAQGYGHTPEDALCNLAIELFKHGMLVKN